MMQHRTPASTMSHRTVAASGTGRTTLVMTGFGPFPSVPVNATMTLVPRLAEAARRLFPAVDIVTEILPTEWVAAPARIDRLIELHRPDIVLHFGVSGRARGFEIETRGRNACAMIPDASGRRPLSPDIRDDGNTLLPSRIPVAEIVRRLRRQGVPAFRSWSAGTYLCNATLYHVLTETIGRSCEAGFVHVPDRLASAGALALPFRTRPGCPMTWTQALRGGLEIIATVLNQPTPNATRRTVAMYRRT